MVWLAVVKRLAARSEHQWLIDGRFWPMYDNVPFLFTTFYFPWIGWYPVGTGILSGVRIFCYSNMKHCWTGCIKYK